MIYVINKQQLEVILETFENLFERLSADDIFTEKWDVYWDLKMLNTDLLGLDLKSAQEKLKQENKIYRIIRIDNVDMIGTCDFNPDRLNLEVENNIIVNVTNG